MKILFDGVFNADPTSGVHRYFYDLINNLPAEYYKFSSTSLSRTTIPHHYIPFFLHFRPNKVSFFLEYLWFKKKFYNCHFDCVHSAYYNLSKACQILIQKKIPHVITVHDLIHEIFNIDNKNIINSRKHILENANAIITVSENTKNDLLNTYPLVKEDKVFVIHHGIVKSEKKIQLRKENFLLYVGHREGYKNFKVILPALKELVAKYSIKLIVVGPSPTSAEKKQIKVLNLDNFIDFRNNVSDKELQLLYSKCLAFVYPSLYEGFGYPLIEAMSNGAIPIGSNTSCVPEVLGSSGVAIDLQNHKILTKTISKIIVDSNFRKSLQEASLDRIKNFSMRITIKKTMDVYQSLKTNHNQK